MYWLFLASKDIYKAAQLPRPKDFMGPENKVLLWMHWRSVEKQMSEWREICARRLERCVVIIAKVRQQATVEDERVLGHIKVAG